MQQTQQINKTSSKQMLSPGEIFQKRRISLRKSLQQACDETKIQEKYLQMLEDNEFDSFENEVFMIGFIKIYSKYLGLNVEKILALTRRMIKKEAQKPTVVIKKTHEKKAIPPKLIMTILLGIVITTVTLYFFYQLYNFQQVPELIVAAPEDNITVNTENIPVSGYTDENVVLLINDINTEITSEGQFNANVDLIEGVNTITVKAIRESNRSKETVIVRTIIYAPEASSTEQNDLEEELEEVEPEPIVNRIRLDVTGGFAWIQLLVDSEQVIGNSVSDGFSKEYIVEEDFQIITGKTNITKVYLNDSTDPADWIITDGVGSINCRLVNESFSCDN